MINKTYLTTLMLIFYLASTCFAESWKKIGESNGIEKFVRPSKTASVNEVMARGIVKAPISVVESVLRDIHAQTKYSFLCSEAHEANLTGFKNTKDSFYIYNKTDMPFPVSDRDAFARLDFTISPSGNEIRGKGTVINTQTNKPTGVVRMTRGWNEFLLRQISPDETLLEYTIAPDPAGNLPGALVKILSRNMAASTIKKIRLLVKQDKYSKVKTIITSSIE
jgi:hypothetical protein